jgi:hypothetical protein
MPFLRIPWRRLRATPREHPDVLAFANYDDIYVGRSVGLPRQGVSVARRATEHVGFDCVGRDAVGIGPVILQAFPDATGALGDIGVMEAKVMHLEVRIGALCKDLRAARPEVGA